MKRALALLLAAVASLLPGAAPCRRRPAAYAWQQHPGARLPLDTVLTTKPGASHAACEPLFAGRPVILDLGYYHCPSLVRRGARRSVQRAAASGLVAGADYTLVALSIDPAETPRDAAQAKAADLARPSQVTGGRTGII